MTNERKRRYRLRNWRDYNAALARRGSLTLWVEQRPVDAWRNHDHAARRGRRRPYAAAAVTCRLMLREVYHLPPRATEGLAPSLLPPPGAEVPAPDYSQLSRRARRLRLALSAHAGKKVARLVIDSTGLKLYGEGGWQVKAHGWVKHRTWRKLHLGVGASTHLVAAVLITEKEVVDPRALPHLLRQVGASVGRVYADGAYDARGCYRAIREKGARAVIPPRKGSTLWNDEYPSGRNADLRRVRERGAAAWKQGAKYHRRSLAETAVYRFKTLFSDRLRSREVERQRAEVMVRCVALNRMTELGMPRSHAI